MPLEGLRWSRDSGSALYNTSQTAVLGRAGGASCSIARLANPQRHGQLHPSVWRKRQPSA